jgi:hypothetical protein
VIRDNTVGKAVDGGDLPGGSIGIRLEGWCGFCDLVEGNVMANASEHGLSIAAPGTKIFGNRIEGSGAAGILVYSPSPFAASRTEIGADTAEEENTISASGGAAIEIREDAPFGSVINNTVGRNHGATNAGPFIALVEGANRGILAPTFSAATQAGAEGEGAEPEATIRVFRKGDPSPGEIESFLAEAVADEDGNWAVVYPSPVPGGTVVAASQTTAEDGTSEFGFATTPAPAGGEEGGGGAAQQPKANPPLAEPDTTAPETTIVAGPKARSRSRTARFRFVASELSPFRCKLDRRRARGCRSPRVYRHLKAGRHVFRVWAFDAAGNREARPAKWVFRIRRGKFRSGPAGHAGRRFDRVAAWLGCVRFLIRFSDQHDEQARSSQP